MSTRVEEPDSASEPLLTPYPRGWYVIAESADLPIRGVQPVHVFGRELVVFRAEDGSAHVVDAHCPHLGAHLGHGGKVADGCLRCPFHGWEYEVNSGQCVRTASGDKAPPAARLRKWHVSERHGVILVWFHEAGEAPGWTVAALPDIDGAWSEWTKRTWMLPARIQDVSENDADVAHSPVMHGLTDRLPRLGLHTEGATCDWHMELDIKRSALGLPALPRIYDMIGVPSSFAAVIDVRRSGLSLGWIRQRMELPGGFVVRTQSLASTTPIDADNVRLVMRHRVALTPVPGLSHLIRRQYANLFNSTVDEDCEIWRHKIYRLRPVPSKSDWSVLEFRKWAKQFYAEGAYELAMQRAQQRQQQLSSV